MDVSVGPQRRLSDEELVFFTVVLEKILESSLDCKDIKPVIPKGNQSWIFIGRTDAEAEALVLWSPDAKNWLIWKDPHAGKDWRQEEKGMTGPPSPSLGNPGRPGTASPGKASTGREGRSLSSSSGERQINKEPRAGSWEGGSDRPPTRSSVSTDRELPLFVM